MPPQHCNVLVVDDDRAMIDLLATDLTQRGFVTTGTTTPTEALEWLRTGDIDVLVTDLRMEAMHGLELCERALELRPDVPVIVMTAFGTFETAIAAMRAGASDFLTKPFETVELAARLERAIRDRALRAEVKKLRDAVDAATDHGDMVGESAAMQRVYQLVARVAPTDSTVLVTGPSGTGKELVARLLHRRGRRASGPFVAINCAAMPEHLLESELFGHVKGAFTDARTARRGLFLQAHGGTIFLDEVGEMPLPLQAKLLRVLQERTVRPVGAEEELAFDARIVAASNRDLETAVEEKRFREDLLYRLNVVQIELPPLSSRGADVLVLAQHFVKSHSARAGKSVVGITPEAARRLLEYGWPGNVRELSNAIERAVALTSHDHVTLADLPDKIQAFRPAHVLVTAEDPQDLVSLEEVEKRYILRVMDAVEGNRTRAAQILGVDRKTLYHKLRAWGAGGPKDD